MTTFSWWSSFWKGTSPGLCLSTFFNEMNEIKTNVFSWRGRFGECCHLLSEFKFTDMVLQKAQKEFFFPYKNEIHQCNAMKKVIEKADKRFRIKTFIFFFVNMTLWWTFKHVILFVKSNINLKELISRNFRNNVKNENYRNLLALHTFWQKFRESNDFLQYKKVTDLTNFFDNVKITEVYSHTSLTKIS